MDKVSVREIIVTVICFSFAAVMAGIGVYEFITIEFVFRDMLSYLGVCLMFIALGLNPKMFFIPCKKLFSVTPPETLVSKGIYEPLLFSGVALSLFTALWRLFS